MATRNGPIQQDFAREGPLVPIPSVGKKVAQLSKGRLFFLLSTRGLDSQVAEDLQ